MILPRLPVWLVCLLPFTMAAAERLSLSGTWQVALDPGDAGRAERWFTRDLSQPIELPGSLSDARLGLPVTVETPWIGGIFDRSFFTEPEFAPYRRPGAVKVPFWLQPETHYVGAAWYQRTVTLPRAWAGRRVTLLLERPHWRTTVWLDGRELGSGDANGVAHTFELGSEASPGPHRLTVCVDNRNVPDLGENSHSISDHTQGTWNGIVGRIELVATAPVWIEDLEIRTDFAARTATVRGRLGRAADQAWPASVELSSPTAAGAPVHAPVSEQGAYVAVVAFGAEAAAWDEFTPALHRLTAVLANGERREQTFGFREIRAEGRQLRINGRPLFLRGTLDCAIFPRTGHPPTDVASWRRVLEVVRAHGLNHVRYHSWCPPEAAFVAADELGVYLQVEAGVWPNHSTTLGDGKPVDAWLEAESERMLRAYGNHPSFVIFCAGNEPGGPRHPAWLSGWVERRKARDPNRLYTAGAGWPEVPESDFHSRSEPRIQSWGEGLNSRINALAPETRTDYADFVRQRTAPVVSHEIGQWCVYPNYAELPKYTGYLKPRNLEIFRDALVASGMGAQARDFLHASGRLQVLCYKEDIESALRTPEMGGFQLLGLQDFSGQGTALVGVVDAFWESKGYVSPEEFRRFCSSTVPLARLDKRVFTTEEQLVADVEVAHFGPAPLVAATASWRCVADDGRVVARGAFVPRTLAVGAAQPLGRVELALDAIPAPARYRFVVGLDGTPYENDWDIWVYPPAARVVTPLPAGVTLATRLDAGVEARLAAGETVWLMVPPAKVRPDAKKGKIALGFSSIFWNTAWTNGQAPHTLGMLCDPASPALAAFPTEAHSNWQWWYVLRESAPMILQGLPGGVQPILQVVDDWFTHRKLALAFAVRVGPGRLLVTSIDLRDAVLDPVRRQLRASLLAYAASPRFDPATSATVEQVRSVLVP